MNKPKTFLTFLALLLLMGPTLAGTAQAEAAPPHPWASWQLQWENDLFVALDGSDKHYTNGIRFSWILNEHPPRAEKFRRWWCTKTSLCGSIVDSQGGSSPINPEIAYGSSIGHSFYTPEDILEPSLITTDRPYAGYLYYSTQLDLRSDTDRPESGNNRPTQNSFDLQFGFIGRENGGELLQKLIHAIIEDDKPGGWDNQLGFEPVVQAVYVWRRKAVGNSHFDAIPHWGGAVGNAAVFGNVGGTLRAGFNLGDFPILNITPSVGPTDLSLAPWEFHLFVGADGRAVAHNIFLDGNAFRESHSVDKESFVYDLRAGLVGRCGQWRVSYTFTRRSQEFSSSLDDSSLHDFGSIALGRLVSWAPRRGDKGFCARRTRQSRAGR